MEIVIMPQKLKLKQASAVVGISPKELQNLVQFGVIRPQKRGTAFWFDGNLLMQAKIAIYLKQSLGMPVEYLARITQRLSPACFENAKLQELWIKAAPVHGRPQIEIKVPLRQLRKELMNRLPLGQIIRDLPRGRKRKGWKREFISTLQEIGEDLGEVSAADVRRTILSVRSRKKSVPEIVIVTKGKKTA